MCQEDPFTMSLMVIAAVKKLEKDNVVTFLLSQGSVEERPKGNFQNDGSGVGYKSFLVGVALSKTKESPKGYITRAGDCLTYGSLEELQSILQIVALLINDDYWNRSDQEPVKAHQDLRGVIRLGRPEYYKYRYQESAADLCDIYAPKKRDSLWHYQNCIYEVTTPSLQSEEENRLLILDEVDRERQKFEYLKRKFESPSSKEIKFKRAEISEEVRIAIWRRDQGKCAKCGGRENLEYDHIIPVSKGGSSTVRNIELLCEKCNRKKGSRI